MKKFILNFIRRIIYSKIRKIKEGDIVLLKTIEELKEEFTYTIDNEHFISIDIDDDPGIPKDMRQHFGQYRIVKGNLFWGNLFKLEDTTYSFHISYIKKVLR